MNKVFKLVKNNYFIIFTIFILVLAFVFRFYDYQDRYALGPDQAGFALQSKFALESGQLPLLGPFSSAGPFQTGGQWYWFVMLGYLLVPFSYLAPWIFLTLSSILFIILIMFFSKKLIDEKFAIIVGVLSAFSTGQVAQSVNLTNQSPMALFSLGALISAYLLVKTNKSIFSFILGLLIGTAASIHLQGVAMIPIFISTFIIFKIVNPKKILLFIFGGALPWIPVLVTDLNNNFYTVKNMVYYYLLNKDPIPFEALGRRWLTFAFDFIPNSWANVVGGSLAISYFIIISSVVLFTYLIVTKKIKKEWIIIYLSLGISFILLRYTRTPIFYSYIVFLHPLIFLITGYVIYNFFKINRALGFLVISIVIIATFFRTAEEIKISGVPKTYIIESYVTLKNFNPNSKFTIYDHKYETSGHSLPLVFLLEKNNSNSLNGIKIGVSVSTNSAKFSEYQRISVPNQLELYNLDKYKENELLTKEWIEISPERIFNVTQNWYK